MVDALREARRVLAARGVLIDVRPVVAPLVVEIAAAAQAIWMKEVASYSAPEDVAAADAAVLHAVSNAWFAFEKSARFDFQILCDTVEDLRTYVQGRKLHGEEIPYGELEQRLREAIAGGPAARLRCHRRWMLSAYRKI